MSAMLNTRRYILLASAFVMTACATLVNGSANAAAPAVSPTKAGATGQTTFTGKVIEIDVGGYGKNSAQLEFSLQSKGGQKATFAVWMDTEPQVFDSMTTLLSMAYSSKANVTATLVPTDGTPRAVNIKVPADE